jgi:hypothetical protein
MLPPGNIRQVNPLLSTKKPKLSLQTSDLASTFHGSVSRQTGINANATATPTTFNTFNNTFDLTYRPSPVTAESTPGPLSQRRPSAHPSSPIIRLPEQPYYLNLPFGVNPILKNSPLPRDIRGPSVSASPRVSGRRVFFPAQKKVSFRPELEDEIVTSKYVMRHADLSSSEDESTPSETDEQSSTSNDEEEQEEAKRPAIHVDEVSVRGRRKRKSVAISPSPATDSGRGRDERSRSTSVRRTKRKRKRWEWTLESGNEQTRGEESKDIGRDHVSPVEEPANHLAVDVAHAAENPEQPEQPEEAEGLSPKE